MSPLGRFASRVARKTRQAPRSARCGHDALPHSPIRRLRRPAGPPQGAGFWRLAVLEILGARNFERHRSSEVVGIFWRRGPVHRVGAPDPSVGIFDRRRRRCRRRPATCLISVTRPVTVIKVTGNFGNYVVTENAHPAFSVTTPFSVMSADCTSEQPSVLGELTRVDRDERLNGNQAVG